MNRPAAIAWIKEHVRFYAPPTVDQIEALIRKLESPPASQRSQWFTLPRRYPRAPKTPAPLPDVFTRVPGGPWEVAQ